MFIGKNKSFSIERKQKEFWMQFNFWMHFKLFALFTNLRQKEKCVALLTRFRTSNNISISVHNVYNIVSLFWRGEGERRPFLIKTVCLIVLTEWNKWFWHKWKKQINVSYNVFIYGQISFIHVQKVHFMQIFTRISVGGKQIISKVFFL